MGVGWGGALISRRGLAFGAFPKRVAKGQDGGPLGPFAGGTGAGIAGGREEGGREGGGRALSSS